MRTGFAAGSQFVFSQHAKGARNAGLSEEQLAAIPHWSGPTSSDAKERAVLTYVDEGLCWPTGAARTGTFAALKAHFSDEAILELTYISSCST